MLTRGCFACAVCLSIVVPFGCARQPPARTEISDAPVRETEAVAVNPQDEPPQSEPQDATQPDSADALAQKAQTYSRRIESLLAGRNGTREPTGSAPSEVKWMEPGHFRLDPFAPPQTIAEALPPLRDPSHALVHPVIETSPSEANRIAPARGETLEVAANTPATQQVGDDATSYSESVPADGGALAEKLSARVRDYPRDVSAHLEYQLLLLLLDERVPQLAALAPLPSEDRELVAAILDGVTLFRSTLRSDNNMLLSKKIRPLIAMADRLRSQADLTIPTVALCRSVEGFGKYEPIEPVRFAAGAEHKAIIYCEIANFASNLNDRQEWETRLTQDLVLYTEFGAQVWSDRTEQIVDAARVRRHDFFVNKRISIPSNLTIGRYLLKVTIVDTQANRVAEATVPIVIAAK